MSGPNYIQNEVAEFVRQPHHLTPSLLLSKYGMIGEKVEKSRGKTNRRPLKPEAVRAVCAAASLAPKAPPVWSGRADAMCCT